MASRTRRRVLWFVVGAVAVVVIAAVVGPFVYIHFIEGPAPQKLELPSLRTSTSTSTRGLDSTPSASSASDLDGTWNVGPGSVAGYRVNEVLIGQNSTAVGRTTEISGSLTIAGQRVTTGTFTVNMASVRSDQSARNARFDGPIMDVSRYPTATLTLSAPIALGAVPARGVVKHYGATGVLQMHGVTRPVTFPVSAERSESGIDVLADIAIRFADWDISNPSIGGFVTTADNGTLEVLLHLTQGAGNQPGRPSGPTGPVSGGGPITVPSTTVPPLRVPSG